MSEEMSNNTLAFPEKKISQPKVYGAWATIGMGTAIGLIALIAVPLLVICGFMLVALLNGQNVTNDSLMMTLTTIATGLSGLPLIYLIIRLNGNSGITEYLRLRRLTWKLVFLALASFIIIFVSVIGISVVHDYLIGPFGDATSPGLGDSVTSGFGWLLVLLATVVFAPIFEETFFRGFLFAGLRRSRLGVVGTIIITSLIWALAHQQYDWFGMVKIGLMGVILGVTYYKTDSLWCPIIVHAMWNGMVILVSVPWSSVFVELVKFCI